MDDHRLQKDAEVRSHEPTNVHRRSRENLYRPESDPNIRFSAELVRAPETHRPESLAEDDPDGPRHFDTYVRTPDIPDGLDKKDNLEMHNAPVTLMVSDKAGPNGGRRAVVVDPNGRTGSGKHGKTCARFLPTVSPEDVSVDEPRSISTRITNDDIMETCLDDVEPKNDVSRTVLPPVEIVGRVDVMEVEEGRSVEDRQEKRSLCRRCLYSLKEPTKKVIILIVFIVLAIIVFLGVFPPSFVYLDYGLVALKKTKSTGYVNTNEVVYPGCHILGPDIELKIFTASAITVEFTTLSVFLQDSLKVSYECNFQYFLRPESIGRIHDMFDMDFKNPIWRIAMSQLKTTTTKFTLENIRLNRSFVERKLHQDLQNRLGGSCCPSCCRDACQGHLTCAGCDSDKSTCNPGFYVDVRFFNFGAIRLPEEVTSRLLKTALLYVTAEAEIFKQKSILEQKETSRQVQEVLNDAAEIKNDAEAKAALIIRRARASAYANVTNVEMTGLRDMCANLNVKDMNQKLSMFMIKTFNNMDNLYMASGWPNASMYAGPNFSKNYRAHH